MTTQRDLETLPFVAGDWVRIKNDTSGMIGLVQRVGKDWCDVRWKAGGREWAKRMKKAVLVVEHTISLGNGMTVTDMTREKALRGSES